MTLVSPYRWDKAGPPVPARIGDTIRYTCPLHDGQATPDQPFGAPVPVAGGTCNLVVNDPLGDGNDQTIAGTIADTGSGQNDGFTFLVPTAGWLPKDHRAHVVYDDGTGNGEVTVAEELFRARPRGGDVKSAA